MKVLLSLFIVVVVVVVNGQNDLFNYDISVSKDGYRSYGPEDWGEIQCDDLETCDGWPDKWEYANGWSIDKNHCRWCPDDRCDKHHQSPINLERNRALNDTEWTNECIDTHWMRYIDSGCTFDDIKSSDGFVIDRHALRIIQPVRETTNNVEGDVAANGKRYILDCTDRVFGRIDFAKGFSQYWFLSHIDIHLPSEHTQEGKQYDAELQMYHFYSVTGVEAGINNEMAAVTVFMNVYDDAEDWDVLNRLICAWRESEEKTREECGLDSIQPAYPGCVRYTRGGSDTTTATTQSATGERQRKANSAHDILIENHKQLAMNATYKASKISMHKDAETDYSDFDWDAFIASQYEQDQAPPTHGRQLLNYDHVRWFNYFAMLKVRTEYYYRYSGTQTIPPCYGEFMLNANRKQTNHWRIMKDPVRISQRQLDEMNRLLVNRIAPIDDPIAPCENDTAGKVVNGKIQLNRPIQSFHNAHHKVFCECQDWQSKWIEDQQWCEMKDPLERLYEQPYNFKTDDF